MIRFDVLSFLLSKEYFVVVENRLELPLFFVLLRLLCFIFNFYEHSALKMMNGWNFDKSHALNTKSLFFFFLFEVYLTNFRTQFWIFEHIIVWLLLLSVFCFLFGGIYQAENLNRYGSAIKHTTHSLTTHKSGALTQDNK